MKNFKSSSLLTTNLQEIKACILILETNKKEGEDFVYHAYKTNSYATDLVYLKGVILASLGISNGVLGEDYEIMIIEDFKEKASIIESAASKKQSCIMTTHNQIEYSAKYKVCSRSFLKNYLVSAVLPASIPDNCIKFVCNELIESLSAFFESFEGDEVKRLYSDVINKFCEYLIFATLIHTIPSEKEDFNCSSIMFPYICNTIFFYNSIFPIYMIKPPLSDRVKSEMIEIVNTINSDRSVLQETLTLMDPPLFLRGVVLTFRGFVIYTSLSNSEFENLARVGTLYGLHDRNHSSGETLICENVYINNSTFLIENETFQDEEAAEANYTENFSSNINNNTNSNLNALSPNLENNMSEKKAGNNKLKKTIVATLLAQREFVLYCYLDILNTKVNSSFDVFYHKRAEDLLIGLLKKSYQNTIKKDLSLTSISMNSESNSKDVQNNSTKSGTQLKPQTISKINGLYDHENKVNIIHYSIYNDTERIINTSLLEVDPIVLQEVYRVIFNHYSKIQSNLNKLQNRSKNQRIREMQEYSGISKQYAMTLKTDPKIKTKLLKDNFLNEMNTLKLNELGVKVRFSSNQPSVWVCCKIYEHHNPCDDTIEEYSNYKAVFLAYESENMIDIDSFCQDLLINELFT